MKVVLKAVDWMSGEWMLRHHANNGAIIFLRSLLVTAWLFGLALLAVSAIDPNTTREFSLHELRSLARDHIEWLGAILAATYVGFYSRYASQWNYIATLYNQIMATCTSIPVSRRNDNQTLHNWQAGFIEDTAIACTWTEKRFSQSLLDKCLAIQEFGRRSSVLFQKKLPRPFYNATIARTPPNNSFKPRPLRGLVQVLLIFTYTRPQSGPS